MESRKQAILKAVVTEFADSATPVGSHVLADRYFLNLSSATIRTELAELADLGYLQQPHTSAGRIPTDRGYRYFVDFLMEDERVPVDVQAFAERRITESPADTQALLERVATTVATITENAALVTAPHGAQPHVKHLDLVSLEPREVLLVLLVEGNLIRHVPFRVVQEATQDELSRLSKRLNRELAGKDGEAVELRRKRVASGLEQDVLARVAECLAAFQRSAETMVVHDGVRNLLRQPEFSESARLNEVLEVLEETRFLSALLQQLVGDSNLQVVIGAENPAVQLRTCSVMLTLYGPSAGIRGALGVLGPTRMRYGQVAGRLRLVARLASRRLTELGA